MLANKKLILAQLLRDGNIKALPSYVSPPVARNLRRFMQPYTAFADTYASKDRGITQSSLEEVASMHATVFDTDGVVPLISILIQRHPLRRIQRLGNSFTKLTIRDVVLVLALQGQQEAVSDAEQRVLKFVEHLVSKAVCSRCPGLSLRWKATDLRSSFPYRSPTASCKRPCRLTTPRPF